MQGAAVSDDRPAQGPRWVEGWWSLAHRRPAHPGRVGGPIKPFGAVIHTTDMLPDEWDALVASWTGKVADGACANFLIGRTPEHGVLQLIPITRNGNHAGGPWHGVYRAPGLPDMHPNSVAVGIEVHCAGGVRLINGQWRLVEDGIPRGAALPPEDVTLDPQRPGRGWHHATDYQRERLGALLDDLEPCLAPVPPGTVKVAFGETPPAYAVIPGARWATHAELDPRRRADPWPELSGWLRARATR
jgi:hypothetical protein